MRTELSVLSMETAAPEACGDFFHSLQQAQPGGVFFVRPFNTKPSFTKLVRYVNSNTSVQENRTAVAGSTALGPILGCQPNDTDVCFFSNKGQPFTLEGDAAGNDVVKAGSHTVIRPKYWNNNPYHTSQFSNEHHICIKFEDRDGSRYDLHFEFEHDIAKTSRASLFAPPGVFAVLLSDNPANDSWTLVTYVPQTLSEQLATGELGVCTNTVRPDLKRAAVCESSYFHYRLIKALMQYGLQPGELVQAFFNPQEQPKYYVSLYHYLHHHPKDGLTRPWLLVRKFGFLPPHFSTFLEQTPDAAQYLTDTFSQLDSMLQSGDLKPELVALCFSITLGLCAKKFKYIGDLSLKTATDPYCAHLVRDMKTDQHREKFKSNMAKMPKFILTTIENSNTFDTAAVTELAAAVWNKLQATKALACSTLNPTAGGFTPGSTPPGSPLAGTPRSTTSPAPGSHTEESAAPEAGNGGT